MIAAMAVEIFVYLYIVSFGLVSALAIFMLVTMARRLGDEEAPDEFESLERNDEDPDELDRLEQ